MTDALSDVIGYWNIRCDDCKTKYPITHNICNRNTFKCKFINIENNLCQ